MELCSGAHFLVIRIEVSKIGSDDWVVQNYYAAGQLIGLTNKDGTNVSYTYDANGNNLTVTDEEGYVVSYVYDADGRMTELTNARGYKTAYEYDSMAQLTKVIDALDGETTYTYDAVGNLTSETNEEGYTTSYTYDLLGQVTSITNPREGVTRAEYDGNGNITKITQADGKSTTYTYDAANRLTSYVDVEGYTWSFVYDPNGNVIAETDGNGNTTHYTYDGLNRQIGKVDAKGNGSSVEFDADGRKVKVVDEEGAVTQYVYDDCNRVIKMVDALGYATEYTYDEMDRVLTVTDARKGVTTYTYTDRGDIATETDAEGYVISYEYDGNRNMVKKTTVDGDTIQVFDPLDRLISVTTPDGETETFTYDGVDQIVTSTDKGGHTTRYTYDGNGNVTSATDAKGNVTTFEYDIMDNLSKVTLHRVDEQDGVDEYEVTLYEYDGRGLQTKVVDALGNVTVHQYDGNGNLVKTTDADGYVTEYTMDALDLIEHINYNGGKQVDYQYNKTGDLVKMEDWSGTTTYEVDLLHRITATTDRLGKHVAYTYDGVGNQTSVSYPDGTVATKEYDLVKNLTKVVEEDGRTTTYEYDGMGRVTHMNYPDGWQEDYHYDAIGQLTAIEDTDPTQKDMKQQKNTFEYDVCGNMIHEYMRGNGTGETTTDVTYTYDELHRVTSAKELYGNAWRNYQYDSLGNLTYEENSNSVHYDYKLNNLNQVTEKHYATQDHEGTIYTYDKRGNLVLEEYGKFNGNPNGQKRQTVAEYVYDETNKMVEGTNSIGESSAYLFNGKNALVEQTWHIAKNGYGYHDVDATEADLAAIAELARGKGGNGSGGSGHGNGNGQGNGNGSGDKPTGSQVGSFSTVVKQFVIDYTVETMDPLMEHEVNGLDYRYVYGNERLSVNISPIPNGAGHIVESGTVGQQIRLYYHQDLRGTVDYLTSPVSQKVESWTHYNEWGEIVHNAVLKTGYRELDLVKNYTGHDFDAVLNMYYAKARMYDAENRRFVALDPIMDGSRYDISERVTDPTMFVQYLYVKNMPLVAVDPLGRYFVYKYTDEFGKRYYQITTQSKIDAVISPVVSAFGDNWQSLFHEISTKGELVGGTSALDNSRTWFEDFEAIHGPEIEQAKQGIASTGHLGAALVTIYNVGSKVVDIGGTIFIEVPAAWKVTDRDKILLQVMQDAQISTEQNYLENFVSAAYTADQFIQSEEVSWIFMKQSALGGVTPYQVGKAASAKDTTASAYVTAHDKIYSTFYNMIYGQITEALGIEMYTYWGEKVKTLPLAFMSSAQDFSKREATQYTEAYLDALGLIYDEVISAFTKLFCLENNGE